MDVRRYANQYSYHSLSGSVFTQSHVIDPQIIYKCPESNLSHIWNIASGRMSPLAHPI